MRAEGCSENSEISLLLCGDKRIRALNRIWRRKDVVTDVLSFPQTEEKGEIAAPRRASEVPVILGDIVISVQTAAKQAKAAGILLQKELNFLLIHGILHLLGWDDASPTQRRRMLARQEEILEGK
ncbi:MAG: rRNA maturation RNase YbeY [Armatimonadetes bacterium]|nr:rRNA maturation RNase YbeY [Armatimonadota bacterium]NIM23401.1 rRNA maturation RNase YbeY [Armatimonadota bacterium]NIM67266.1 rRNA maturation RNase YbeY [Armatimonadota bacterium]NIM75764.1 rRNA maturation RNase YbeY [Armatimonadota bacterium]NIN05452.1 rRNA maturation RNase YbeY [Armatimonadota bacterium]